MASMKLGNDAPFRAGRFDWPSRPEMAKQKRKEWPQPQTVRIFRRRANAAANAE
jgi:hypothetical protein